MIAKNNKLEQSNKELIQENKKLKEINANLNNQDEIIKDRNLQISNLIPNFSRLLDDESNEIKNEIQGKMYSRDGMGM